MTDRPIIFSGPMVHALINGRKTQTRRVLNGKTGILAARSVAQSGAHWLAIEYDRSWPLKLPYAPGDRLWVREVWGLGVSDHGDCPRYKATMDYQCGDRIKSPHEGPFKWRSPIHMPRWASRLTLTVTDVRVQRLQEISASDACQEGADSGQPYPGGPTYYVDNFQDLWNSIHGPDAWDANPWVCALTFTVERRNIDQ